MIFCSGADPPKGDAIFMADLCVKEFFFLQQRDDGFAEYEA